MLRQLGPARNVRFRQVLWHVVEGARLTPLGLNLGLTLEGEVGLVPHV